MNVLLVVALSMEDQYTTQHGNVLFCQKLAPIYQIGYSIGALAIEALTAIAGPQSNMAVLTLMGRGQAYETAFKNVYGISWAEAAPILARVAAAEYAATP